MKLIIVRHGETEENAKGLLLGHTPGKLNAKGKSQAKKLAKRLKKDKINIIFCSDLKRTKDTAKEIVKFHPDTPVHYVKALRERNYGIYERKNSIEVRELFKKKGKDFFKAPIKNGESEPQKDKRIIKFLDKCLNKYPDRTVLWISHGGAIMSLLKKFIPITENSQFKKYAVPNAAVSILEFDSNGNHKMRLINCIKHL